MADEIEFVDGLIVKAPHEKAPSFVKAYGPSVWRGETTQRAPLHGPCWPNARRADERHTTD
jgi:hypothetical protein